MAQPEEYVVFERDGRAVQIANTDPSTAVMLIEAGQDDGQPHQVPDRPAMTVIRLDLAGSGLSVTGPGGGVLVPDGLVIGFDTGPSLATVQRLILVAAAGVLAAIIALVAATVIIVSRSLRPLKAMSERAHAFAAGDRSVRLPVPDDDPDMHRLAVTVNEAFDVQETAGARVPGVRRRRLAPSWYAAHHRHRLDRALPAGRPDRPDPPRSRDGAGDDPAGEVRVLIDDLALLARLDRARPLDLDAIDLTVLAGEVLERPGDQPRPAVLLHAAGPATLFGDGPKLQQVLQNLLGDAVQHTPAGTPVEVTVRPARPDSRSRDRPGGSVHTLLVTDHGPGIAAPIRTTSSPGSGAATPAVPDRPAAQAWAWRSCPRSSPLTVVRPT